MGSAFRRSTALDAERGKRSCKVCTFPPENHIQPVQTFDSHIGYIASFPKSPTFAWFLTTLLPKREMATDSLNANVLSPLARLCIDCTVALTNAFSSSYARHEMVPVLVWLCGSRDPRIALACRLRLISVRLSAVVGIFVSSVDAGRFLAGGIAVQWVAAVLGSGSQDHLLVQASQRTALEKPLSTRLLEVRRNGG